MTPAQMITLEIEDLGAEGDGIARRDGSAVYIPFALPGETVTLKGPLRSVGKGNSSGEIGNIDTSSPDRIEPSCRHFGQCGGCRLQHVSTPAVEIHKRRVLEQALSRKGLTPETLSATVSAPLHSRRRARFDYQRTGRSGKLGFKIRRSHDSIDIAMCPILTPSLEKLVGDLRRLLDAMPSMAKGGAVQVTETDSGFDILLIPARPADLNLEQRERIAVWCAANNIARLCWDDGDGPQPVAARHQPQTKFGEVPVDLPVNAFLQPSAAGEKILVDLVQQALSRHCRRTKRIADLFSGCGSLSLPIAGSEGCVVDAFDIDGAMIAALRQAASRSQPVLRVNADRRDLFNAPLTPSELKPYDAVIFDPPKAGAAAQAGELATSSVPVVIAVSCNPSTLSRDLRQLVDGGYTLISSTPVDQFTWSGQLEAVAVLTKRVK
ncbi:MAG: hypothetical protein RIM72_03565 [Alphaproteobacteria bacterium]